MAIGQRAGSSRGRQPWLGWVAAVVGLVAVAFFIGRAGSEMGVLSSTATPSPPSPRAITFGTALDPVSGEATGATERFRAGDVVAYSLRLAAPPGVDHVLVEVIRLVGDTEEVAQAPSEQKIKPNSAVMGWSVDATIWLTAWGPGTYAMRIYLPERPDPIATGGFTLVETPVAS
jgi:hypothetical protein